MGDGTEGWFALILLASIIILVHVLFWEEDRDDN